MSCTLTHLAIGWYQHGVLVWADQVYSFDRHIWCSTCQWHNWIDCPHTRMSHVPYRQCTSVSICDEILACSQASLIIHLFVSCYQWFGFYKEGQSMETYSLFESKIYQQVSVFNTSGQCACTHTLACIHVCTHTHTHTYKSTLPSCSSIGPAGSEASSRKWPSPFRQYSW